MATAKNFTLTPLDKAAMLCGIHPLHFNQVMFSINGRQQGCGEVWLQYDWQKPSLISRESFAEAIVMAESDIEDFLGFPIVPRWYTATVPVNGSPIVLPKAYFIEAGVPKTVKIGEYPVTYSDEDEDGYSETATVVIPPNLVGEIAVFYPGETDGWRIQPVKISGTTITLRREQLVQKKLLEALSPDQVLGDEDDNFLSSVDIYQITADNSTNALLYGPCQCGGGCQTCTFSTTTACMTVDDHKTAAVRLTPANWSLDQLTWVRSTCTNPQVRYAEVNFKAGWTGADIWTEVVVYLALSRLETGLCQCPTVKNKLEWWSTDMSRSTREASFKIPKFMDYCPWGYTRGAMYAFSLAWKYRMAQGVSGSV